MRTSDTSRFCASSAARRAATERGAIAVSEIEPAKRASGIWLCSSATLPWSEMPRLARYAEYLAAENLPFSWNSGALVIASITASRLMNMCARAASLATRRWRDQRLEHRAPRISGESSIAGSIAPPNMRRSCSCCRRSSSANSRCEMSMPFTVATVSRAAAELGIGLDSPGREGDRDQPEEDLDDALVLVDEIEHGLRWRKNPNSTG